MTNSVYSRARAKTGRFGSCVVVVVGAMWRELLCKGEARNSTTGIGVEARKLTAKDAGVHT